VLKDPHYGASLFHFYQEHYFSAVTSLMVSQHFERVAQHADEAEVLRGGLLLSYGLHREAGEIFAALGMSRYERAAAALLAQAGADSRLEFNGGASADAAQPSSA